jgi:hypothetical protein
MPALGLQAKVRERRLQAPRRDVVGHQVAAGQRNVFSTDGCLHRHAAVALKVGP